MGHAVAARPGLAMRRTPERRAFGQMPPAPQSRKRGGYGGKSAPPPLGWACRPGNPARARSDKLGVRRRGAAAEGRCPSAAFGRNWLNEAEALRLAPRPVDGVRTNGRCGVGAIGQAATNFDRIRTNWVGTPDGSGAGAAVRLRSDKWARCRLHAGKHVEAAGGATRRMWVGKCPGLGRAGVADATPEAGEAEIILLIWQPPLAAVMGSWHR